MKNRLYQIMAVSALCLASAALAVALWSTARAQEAAPEAALAIPSTLNYQGFLREPDGSLTTGVYDITASIYNVATGGVPLYTTTLLDVTVRDGLFNIVLGDNPAMPSSVFTNAPLYIGISLNGGTELIPRQRLHAVPWAFQASTLVNNATVQGLTSNGDITVNGTTTMNGNATITGGATINGNAAMNANLSCNGVTTLNGNTVINGDTLFNDGDLIGDLVVTGNISTTGNISSTVRGGLLIPGDGWYGDWYPWKYCPQYTYVCGVAVRIEGPQGGGGDDTSMNGIRLICCSLGRDPKTVPVSGMEDTVTLPEEPASSETTP